MTGSETIPDDVVRRRLTLPATGVEIAIQDWGGAGPLALFHHANGFCAALFAPVIEPLRDRYRVIALDARGSGDSPPPPGGHGPGAYAWDAMAQDVIGVATALLDETGAPRFALGVGHSFGGTLVMAAEAARPGLFGRILAIDPVTPPPPGEWLGDAMPSGGMLLAERTLRRRHIWPSRAAARAYFAERDFFRAWRPRALDLYVGEGLRERPDGQVELKCAREAEAGVFASGRDFDVFARLAGLRPPVRFLWARRGDFPREAYVRLVASMHDARIEDVDTGHLVPMEDPDAVVAAIRRLEADG